MRKIKDDFTLESYRQIIELAKDKNYQFISFEQVGREETEHTCLLRHDIDSELWSCLGMAKLEEELGIRATYFLMLRSTAYNLFCIESLRAVEKIVRCGHRIGLHFMGELTEKNNAEEIGHKVLLEVDILKREFGNDINAVSFHQPTESLLNYDLQIGNLINTYSKSKLKDYYYFSDTNMKWKGGHPQEILLQPDHCRLQLLIHPIWWTRAREGLKKKWLNILEYNRKILVKHWLERERSLKGIEL